MSISECPVDSHCEQHLSGDVSAVSSTEQSVVSDFAEERMRYRATLLTALNGKSLGGEANAGFCLKMLELNVIVI